MLEDALICTLSTSIEISGESLPQTRAMRTVSRPRARRDTRPEFRSDLPLPTAAEMANDGGAAALIAASKRR